MGAAIGAKGDYLERAAELIKAGVDVIVIDIAHGHSVVMGTRSRRSGSSFGDFELVAGNVATADGARFLAERGVNGIKVGIGPGGGCTTRLTTIFGVPQLQALVECRAARRRTTCRSSPTAAFAATARIVEALLFGGDTVMLGSAFAGTEETPGDVVQKSVVLPESQKVGEGAVQGVPRHGVDPGDPRPARCRRRRRGRYRGARRRRDRGERAGARLGAADRAATC